MLSRFSVLGLGVVLLLLCACRKETLCEHSPELGKLAPLNKAFEMEPVSLADSIAGYYEGVLYYHYIEAYEGPPGEPWSEFHSYDTVWDYSFWIYPLGTDTLSISIPCEYPVCEIYIGRNNSSIFGNGKGSYNFDQYLWTGPRYEEFYLRRRSSIGGSSYYYGYETDIRAYKKEPFIQKSP